MLRRQCNRGIIADRSRATSGPEGPDRSQISNFKFHDLQTNDKSQTSNNSLSHYSHCSASRAAPCSADAPIPYTSVPNSPLRWYDARDLDVEGRGFADVKEYYDRLPAKAERVVRGCGLGPVAKLVRHVRAVRRRLAVDRGPLESALAEPGDAAHGRDRRQRRRSLRPHRRRHVAVDRRRQAAPGPKPPRRSASTLPPGKREYRVYLPLYNGVTSVAIGLPETAAIAKTDHPSANAASRWCSTARASCKGRVRRGPACRNRRSSAAASIGRSSTSASRATARWRSKWPELLAELDPAAYVLDALPNCDATEVKERTEPLVRELRKAHPDTPIVLVEDRTYADAFWAASRKERTSPAAASTAPPTSGCSRKA